MFPQMLMDFSFLMWYPGRTGSTLSSPIPQSCKDIFLSQRPQILDDNTILCIIWLLSKTILSYLWLLFNANRFYFIIFVQGNLLIFYNEEQYLTEYHSHFYLALVFVIMVNLLLPSWEYSCKFLFFIEIMYKGYFYLGIPLFFFASICLCMPFMLVMYLVLRRRRHGL